MCAHITFSTGKSFLKKFLENGITSVKGIDFIDLFSKHFQAILALRVSQARLFGFENRQPVENTKGD